MFVSTQQMINNLPDEVIDNNRDINIGNIEQVLETVPSQISTMSYECHICKRSFSSDHGRSIHLHYCRRKNISSNIIEPPIGRDEALDTNSADDDRPILGNLYEQQSDIYVWGELTLKDLEQVINAIYEEVVKWRNIFLLPSGAAGKSYIRETTRLIDAWNNNSEVLKNVALKIVMIMPHLLLQKPSFKAKSKEHSISLSRRLILWQAGEFDKLVREARYIQESCCSTRWSRTPEQVSKIFSKLMLEGNVNAATRLLDETNSGGVLSLSNEVLEELWKKHPASQTADESTLIGGEVPFVDPAIFANIDEASIARAAMYTKGAAGPSGLDALGWRHILVSKNYGFTGKELRESIASMARNLATRILEIQEDGSTSIEAYLSCRLIPLDKLPGVRPIGIGDVIRRIIGKAVTATAKSQIAQCVGPQQLCAGQQNGCEAAVHAMTQAFDQDETDAVLLADAENAFNSINRKVLLHNIQYLCPVLAIYTINCYQSPSRLFVQGGKEISSAEGTTQGDPIAMPIYAIGITPLLREIKEPDSKVTQAAFADDLAGAGKLQQLLTWWNNIVEYGPLLGYNPRAYKSWLVVKEHLLEEARFIFATSNINITVEGHEYLGGFVGSSDGQMDYARKKVDSWIKLVRLLADIAKTEPQAAYAAFIAGFCGHLNYFIRVIPNLSTILHELDQVITNELIPAITDGSIVSSEERMLLSLPVKLGGLGIPIFAECCKTEYQNSTLVCSQQVAAIANQNRADNTQVPPAENYRGRIVREKGEMQKAKLEQLRVSMSKEQIRANDIAQLKGSSSWLTALPIKKEGYVLSKRQFFDALALRYRWKMKRLPSFCACGKQFTVDHAILCLKGGFIHRRHDELRDIFANLLNEVAYDVRVEPPLTPLTGANLPSGSNIADDARLDIAARGFWERCEMAFFDVRVFNPYARTHLNQSLNAAFTRNEREKKRQYNQRCVQVEHASFTPLVFSAYGGCSRETHYFLNTLSEQLSDKRGIFPGVAINWLRTKICFAQLRALVLCVQGSRSPWHRPSLNTIDIELSNLDSDIN